MSKFLSDRVYRMTDEEGDLIVSCVVKGSDRQSARLAVEEMKGAKKLLVEIKEYKSRRSLGQNRLLWSLLGKMAEAVSGKRDRESTEDCYAYVLEEANVKSDFLCALPEAEPALREAFRVVRKIGERNINGKTLNVYRYYVGSSKYDVAEMTLLIETALDRLAQLGVTDSEINLARGEYLAKSIF